jgi:hypothetical protein
MIEECLQELAKFLLEARSMGHTAINMSPIDPCNPMLIQTVSELSHSVSKKTKVCQRGQMYSHFPTMLYVVTFVENGHRNKNHNKNFPT